MDQKDWLSVEYQKMREEITQRVMFLHRTLSLGVIILVVLIAVAYWFSLNHLETGKLESFVLLWPIVFSLLTFNYQANQMTLEAVARYLSGPLKDEATKDSKTEILSWDSFYGQHKRGQRLASFLKVLPLLTPLLIPVFVLIYESGLPANTTNQAMIWIDLFLFLIVVFNFKYKL